MYVLLFLRASHCWKKKKHTVIIAKKKKKGGISELHSITR